MSLKSFLIVAATVAATTTFATASGSNTFDTDINISADDVLDIGLVSSDRNGVVKIYDFRFGTQGALLGSKPVHAGANSDVRIGVGFVPTADVLAVLTSGGEVVATQHFFIDTK